VGWYVPCGQIEHESGLVDPMELLDKPMPQPVHRTEAFNSLYVPLGQGVQKAIDGISLAMPVECPAMALYVPGRQGKQWYARCDPIRQLVVPAGHTSHLS
jgi:hypothetical protein